VLPPAMAVGEITSESIRPPSRKLAVTFAPGGHRARAVRARCGRFSRRIGRPGPAWEHEAV
jgi:hypothetical protein